MEYYSDIEKVKSKRVYGGDKLYGRSILYDRNGDVTEDSFWLSGTPLSSSRYLHSHDTEHKRFDIVPSSFAQWLLELKTLSITTLPSDMKLLDIQKLRKLESIRISPCGCNQSIPLRIHSCPLLRSIKLQSSSIGKEIMSFDDIPSLEELVIDDFCCMYTSSLKLDSISIAHMRL